MFITFEGLDGSGKTTIIEKFLENILEKFPNLKYVLTREPGGKDIVEAEKIREIILDKKSQLSSVTEALLYSASRRIHLESVIWPALENNHLVLCDRYVDSFYAYQGYARSLGVEYVEELTKLVIDKTMPDITIFFDINPADSKKRRLANRLVHDRMDDETEAFHNKVYGGYLKIIEKEKSDRFIIVDASKSIDEVLEQVNQKLLAHKKFKEFIQNA
ncbi:dTMP kinase [Mycoplasmopsis alligatoris]|uniref:Thymidylate kinase n=1 Tax=Mycoplasmopsis alligatoris A21JP2 TaxID=747682 RepID=D4XWN1_9BACT|nr:dTMP kinase [Mycoplasmopsis alligatoris]EFF41332.1 dTMP kinase [Mycoplasmopsis alligatoris A21JP2]